VREATRKAMEMLYNAKWNIPQAAKHCGLSNKEMKITFNEYCRLNPITRDWTNVVSTNRGGLYYHPECPSLLQKGRQER
jgi:hypothetical protein